MNRSYKNDTSRNALASLFTLACGVCDGKEVVSVLQVVLLKCPVQNIKWVDNWSIDRPIKTNIFS